MKATSNEYPTTKLERTKHPFAGSAEGSMTASGPMDTVRTVCRARHNSISVPVEVETLAPNPNARAFTRNEVDSVTWVKL